MVFRREGDLGSIDSCSIESAIREGKDVDWGWGIPIVIRMNNLDQDSIYIYSSPSQFNESLYEKKSGRAGVEASAFGISFLKERVFGQLASAFPIPIPKRSFRSMWERGNSCMF